MTFAKPTVRRTITPDDLPAEAATVLAGEARLAMVAAHDDRDGFRMVHTFLAPGQPASELITHLPHSQPALPSLAEISFPAGRFEREVRDLFGITPRDHPLPHRLVRHAHWPTGYHAMRHDAGAPTFEADTGSYPFMQVAGSGVYEIPVGPIHAGLIEPGHFRFSVVGETILRLKARLWFVHRGVEKLFEGRSPDEGIELAERISGDTAVGHTLAYCLAVEEALGLTCSEGDAAARALLLELERLYNHVSDIGAIVNDVGYGIVHAHTQTLREHLLRHNKHVTGHRLLRGAINPGSTTLRNLPDLDLIATTAASLAELVDIALNSHIVADRLGGTSILGKDDAAHVGVLGYVARASGLDLDARRDQPFARHTANVEPVVESVGDVRARFVVRAREAAQSAQLIAGLTQVVAGGPASSTSRPSPGPADEAGRRAGFGVVEAWRGALCHRVEITDGVLSRVKVVDPSFFNWPALPIALKDTIVPDFPLTNKSFNQSYAGNDL